MSNLIVDENYNPIAGLKNKTTIEEYFTFRKFCNSVLLDILTVHGDKFCLDIQVLPYSVKQSPTALVIYTVGILEDDSIDSIGFMQSRALVLKYENTKVIISKNNDIHTEIDSFFLYYYSGYATIRSAAAKLIENVFKLPKDSLTQLKDAAKEYNREYVKNKERTENYSDDSDNWSTNTSYSGFIPLNYFKLKFNKFNEVSVTQLVGNDDETIVVPSNTLGGYTPKNGDIVEVLDNGKINIINSSKIH